MSDVPRYTPSSITSAIVRGALVDVRDLAQGDGSYARSRKPKNWRRLSLIS